ncbi:MAG: DNA topoisomerase VI subunit B, partial [Methanolinea sp.]
MSLADELARQQRSISVAEFFEKNKHLLGFDSPTRGLITTVKEAVDNALDACEEAGVLPDIYVRVARTGQDTFRITVEDNGPGIVPEQVPYVFGKLLYGSRFHQLRQSRGQQGIGISAAVLYAQLTTGLPTLVISRTGPERPAFKFLVQIDIGSNEPAVLGREEVVWDRTHGTLVQIEFRSTVSAKKKLLEYLKYTSIVNPHARIRVDMEGETTLFERVSDEPVPCPRAILPHPHGIEIGQLSRMIAGSTQDCSEFLASRFSRVGKKTALEICRAAGIPPDTPAGSLSPAEQKALLTAMQGAKIPPPATGTCLSPIGEDLIVRSLEREFQMDFVRARTRPVSVYSGHPFLVEAAIGYGGKLPADGNATILRFANRVPLMFQQGACAITGCVAGITWKNYNVAQSVLPTGPLLVMVHVASTNVPFTSESKDAIAAIPEIEREITLVLQELGRELRAYLSRREKTRLAEDRARAVCAIIPDIAAKVAEIVELPVPDTTVIEGRLMRKVVVKRVARDGKVRIDARNHMNAPCTLSLYEISPDPAPDASPPPAFTTAVDGEYTRVWCQTTALRRPSGHRCRYRTRHLAFQWIIRSCSTAPFS